MSNAIGDYEGVHFQGNGGGACFRYSALTELGLSLTQLLYAEEDSGFRKKNRCVLCAPRRWNKNLELI
jgi:hypothetical protein